LDNIKPVIEKEKPHTSKRGENEGAHQKAIIRLENIERKKKCNVMYK
jgi:hypothetical protein